MKWLSKDKKLDTTLLRLAGAINKFNNSNLVSTVDSTYYTTHLPFYNDFKFYTFVDLSFIPYLEMHLLDNGSFTFIFDGTNNPFLEANVVSPLFLTTENVYRYAMLVLGNTQKSDNSYRLINSIDDINFTTEPTIEQFQQMVSSIRTPKIKKDNDFYIIKTTLLFNDSVIEASIHVTFDGHVNLVKEKKLLDHMPIQELILD